MHKITYQVTKSKHKSQTLSDLKNIHLLGVVRSVVRSESSAQSRNLNEVSMTKIAIVIVVTFVLLNMLRLILCFFEVAQMFTVMKCLGEGGLGQYQQSLHFHTSDNVARLLMVVNSSVNFLIYSCFSKSFQVNIKSNIQGKSKYRYLIKFPLALGYLCKGDFPYI